MIFVLEKLLGIANLLESIFDALLVIWIQGKVNASPDSPLFLGINTF